MCPSVFDGSLDSFATEVNRRDSGIAISNESHTIPTTSPYEYKLAEIPDTGSTISVSGSKTYTERTYFPTQSGEFYVDYTLGVITHHADDLDDATLVSYTGFGTVADAADMNNRSDAITQTQTILGRDVTVSRHFPSVAHRINTTSGQFQAYADPSLDNKKGFRVTSGRFFTDHTYSYTFGGGEINLGPTYQFQTPSMSPNNYMRVVFTVDQDAKTRMWSGPESATLSGAAYPQIPNYTSNIPVVAVIVQDDGTGAAGTIRPITQYSLEDWRPYFQQPAPQRLASMYHMDRVEYGRTVLTAGSKNVGVSFRVPFFIVRCIQITPEISAGDEDLSTALKIGYRTQSGFQVYASTAFTQRAEINWTAMGGGKS